MDADEVWHRLPAGSVWHGFPTGEPGQEADLRLAAKIVLAFDLPIPVQCRPARAIGSRTVDCDGQINPVDSGIVRSMFGACDPPRDGCP